MTEDSLPVQAHHHHHHHHHHSPHHNNHHHHHHSPSHRHPAANAGPSDGESAGTDTPRSLSPQSTSDHLDSSFSSSGLPTPLPPSAFSSPASSLDAESAPASSSLDRSLQRMQQQALSEASRVNLIKLSQIRSAFSSRGQHPALSHLSQQAKGSSSNDKHSIGQMFALKKRLKAEAMEKDFASGEGEEEMVEGALKDNNNSSEAANANEARESGVNGQHVKEEPMDSDYSPAASPQHEPVKVSGFPLLFLCVCVSPGPPPPPSPPPSPFLTLPLHTHPNPPDTPTQLLCLRLTLRSSLSGTSFRKEGCRP